MINPMLLTVNVTVAHGVLNHPIPKTNVAETYHGATHDLPWPWSGIPNHRGIGPVS